MAWDDAPRGGWWVRRYCRRGGFSILVFAAIVFGIGVEAGSDAAKDLQGRSTSGGTLVVNVLCGSFGFGFGFDPDAPSPPDPCEDRANRARILDDAGNVVMEASPGVFGDFGQLVAERSTARLRLEVTVGNESWERRYYVPDGTYVEHDLYVAREGRSESAHTSSNVIGESRTAHLLGGFGALLAVGAMVGGVFAMLMTRIEWALAAPLLLVVGAAFVAASTPIGLVSILPAFLQTIFVLMAAEEFRPHATAEATVLLD